MSYFNSWTNLIRVVRCKDCVHRPEITDPDEPYGFALTFPDHQCPCRNEDDRWYSWRPDDEWYCPKGEVKVAWEREQKHGDI